MSRLVLSQITIKKERSISSTTWYYLLQPSNASAPDSTNYGNPPPIYSDTGYSGWSTTEPTYTVGDDRVLYTMVQTLYSDNTFSYSTPTISSSYEAAKDAYNEVVQAEQDILELQELGLANGYVWDNMTYVAPTSTIPVYPIGSYIASGMLVNGSRTITRSNSNTYGLNTWISTGGINLRYNAIDLMKLTTSNLEFYYPSTSSQGTKAISLGTNGAINSLVFYGFNNSNKTMELTNNALNFYNPADGSTLLSSLTSNGLILSEGGIVAGTKGQTGYIYLSTVNHPVGTNGVTINGFTPTSSTEQWREVIGTKFGVTNAGTLYANNAVISGTITVGSGSTIDSGATIGGTSASTVVSNAATGAQASSDLSDFQTTVANTYATQGALSDVENQIPDVSGFASKSVAIAEEQLIYIQATSGTNSVSAYPSSSTTTSSYWVTQTGESIPNGTPPDSATGQTPRWTTKRPSYQKNYPVIFVAKQKKTVSGAITCTTPIKDDTTTIIDGGHITTGTIDASKITVTNLQASSIAVGNSNVAAALDTKASSSAEYEVVIKVSSIDYTNSSATLIAIPTKLGEATTGSFVWYKNAINTAHGGTVSTTTNTNDTLTVSDLEALYIAVLQ